METKLFEHFIEVSRSGSFAAAARILNVDPSSVSRAVSQLEAELGVRLFQRTTRQLSLTAAGEQFLARIEGVVTELEQIQDDLNQDNTMPRGHLCLSASVAFGQICIMPLVPDFLQQYPEIQLELKLTDRNVDFASERVDLAIRLAPSLDLDAIAIKLMDTHYRVCASPAYLAQHPEIKQPSDLSQHLILTHDLPDYRKRWIFKDHDEVTLDVAVKPKLIASTALALRDAALSGLGPALLADWLIKQDLASGTLIDLLPDHQVSATNFNTGAWLLYPERAFLPRKTRLAIDFFRQAIKANS